MLGLRIEWGIVDSVSMLSPDSEGLRSAVEGFG